MARMSHASNACSWLPPVRTDGGLRAAAPWRAPALTCKLCEEGYGTEQRRTPVAMACGHTFCRECLESWAAQSDVVIVAAGGNDAGVTCPTCRSVCGVAVEDLPANFAVIDGMLTRARCQPGRAMCIASTSDPVGGEQRWSHQRALGRRSSSCVSSLTIRAKKPATCGARWIG